MRRTNMKKPDWLCNLCWDKRETIIHGTTSTTPAIEHLAECHKINKSGQISDTGSVLQQVQAQAQAENAEEKDPTISCVFQVDLNAFKAALIRWIIVAQKLDDSPAYAAALLLHPRYRLRHFENKWKGHLKKYLGSMKTPSRTSDGV
jgi:hypothetical protein